MKSQEASKWLLRLQGDNVPQAQIAAWLDWCNADPENLAAFDRAQGLYDQLRSADETTRAQFMQLAGESTNRSFFSHWKLAAAAAVVLVIGGVFVWQLRSPLPSVEQQRYQTERGANRTLTLVDRSHIVLGAATTLSSQYTEAKRYVQLNDGEAFFQVERDRTRPFVVQAGDVTVTAIGTAFNVRRTRGRTVVSVTEGSVDVAASQGERPTPVRVSAGQQAVHAKDARGVMVSSVDPVAVTARQGGRFEYIAEPLGSVLDDVNRYSPHAVIVADKQVQELIFTGTVFGQRAEEWVLALNTVFPVNVSRREDGSIVLQARD